MENTNISSLSTGAVIEELINMYGRAIQKNFPFKKLPAVFLWGPSGVGKSEAVQQIADWIRDYSQKKVVVTDARLQTYDPTDLNGIPVADEQHKFVVWLRPKIFAMDESEDVINILFLDELSSAPEKVQGAAYQLVLDRKIETHELPDNCILIAAGNRKTDRGLVYRMLSPLANRMMHFSVKPDFESWKKWAFRSGIRPYVIGYLSCNTHKLHCFDAETDELAFPTPRSWKMVSDQLYLYDDDPELAYHKICGLIGAGNAIEFINWCRIGTQLPETEDIFRGLAKNYPKTPDALSVLVSSMICYTAENKDFLTKEKLKNAFRYVNRFPADFKAMFYHEFFNIKDMKMRYTRKEWTEMTEGAYRL